MKKRTWMISTILFSVIATSFFVSGTFAKYTTTMEGTDQARVAKWGINIVNNVDLFSASTYENVQKSDDDKLAIIAPGTEGSYTFTISGQPEVSYRIKVKVLEKKDDTGRIKFYLNKRYVGDIYDLADAIEQLYPPNQVYSPNTLADVKQTIGWKWEYEETDPDTNKLFDSTDTEFGKHAVTGKTDTGYNTQTKVTLSVAVTAEQVD